MGFELPDIQTEQEVAALVMAFYETVKHDDLIGPYFQRLNWEDHLPKMIHFWSFVLLDKPGYTTQVFEKHMHMRLDKIHFDRWVELWTRAVSERHAGPHADLAIQRARLLGWTFSEKMKTNP
ncbi:MAG: group III truncated hemoglobin [Flavobacteriales bacterium]